MKYFYYFTFIVIVGCTSSKKDTTTYFGGKIINPKTKFIVISKNKKILDTIPLKDNNTFLKKFKNISEGLYTFHHGVEIQYAYLIPNDSLLVRLNTWGFYESLVFSGKGANKNNLLISIFLENKRQKSFFRDFYKLPPLQFKKKVDSIKSKRLQKLKNYQTQNPKISKSYQNTLRIALFYPLYTYLENYSVNHAIITHSKKLTKIDSSFYSYRSKTNISIDSILFFSPYNNYVVSRLRNNTYQQEFRKVIEIFTIAFLKNIQKELSSKKMRDFFSKQLIIHYFYHKLISATTINKSVFDEFFNVNTCVESKKYIHRLLNDFYKLKEGDKLPDFKVINHNGFSKNIYPIISKSKSLIYFTNPNYSSDHWVLSRIRYLSEQNPDIKFIIIHIGAHNNKIIKGLSLKNQFYLPSKSKTKFFLTSGFSRGIFVNKKGIIKNGFVTLFSQKIKTEK